MFRNNVDVPQSAMWDAVNVRDRLVYCIETASLPAQVPVGSDAMYSILLLRHMPIWLQDMLLYSSVKRRTVKPAAMAYKKESYHQ